MMPRTRSRGFTLIELLVVVAIITLLIGVLMPSLSHARAQARQAKALSDLRQMMIGFTMYHQEHDNNLMLGYPPAALMNGFYDARLNRHFTGVFADLISVRYPWRLINYVPGIWPILHSHEVMPPMPGNSDSDAEVQNKAYNLSLYPTYGMNTIYVGGDSSIGAMGYMDVAPFAPIRGAHVAYKSTEVLRPSELIVFAQTRKYGRTDPSASGVKGHYNLTPPRASGVRWHIEDGRATPNSLASSTGMPQGWYKNDVAVGFFDGHAESMKPATLEDMRLWANKAESRTYDFAAP